jgi:hypothetical protein
VEKGHASKFRAATDGKSLANPRGSTEAHDYASARGTLYRGDAAPQLGLAHERNCANTRSPTKPNLVAQGAIEMLRECRRHRVEAALLRQSSCLWSAIGAELKAVASLTWKAAGHCDDVAGPSPLSCVDTPAPPTGSPAQSRPESTIDAGGAIVADIS